MGGVVPLLLTLIGVMHSTTSFAAAEGGVLKDLHAMRAGNKQCQDKVPSPDAAKKAFVTANLEGSDKVRVYTYTVPSCDDGHRSKTDRGRFSQLCSSMKVGAQKPLASRALSIGQHVTDPAGAAGKEKKKLPQDACIIPIPSLSRASLPPLLPPPPPPPPSLPSTNTLSTFLPLPRQVTYHSYELMYGPFLGGGHVHCTLTG